MSVASPPPHRHSPWLFDLILRGVARNDEGGIAARGEERARGSDSDGGGGLADKNYPFKVEKRYKSAVKLSDGAQTLDSLFPRVFSSRGAITIIGK